MPKSKREIKHPHIELEYSEDAQAIPLKVMVSAIHKLADGFEKINDSGLTEHALVLLLHDATKVNKRDIKRILEAAPLLAERYTRETA